jgi:hypothetical protein
MSTFFVQEVFQSDCGRKSEIAADRPVEGVLEPRQLTVLWWFAIQVRSAGAARCTFDGQYQ